MKQYECPWTLIIDNREQSPWLFEDIVVGTGEQKKQLILPRVNGTLRQGDYSISGMADQIAIERGW